MANYHKLADRSLNLAVGEKLLERVDSTLEVADLG